MALICEGIKKNGKTCTYKAISGKYCKIHAKSAQDTLNFIYGSDCAFVNVALEMEPFYIGNFSLISKKFMLLTSTIHFRKLYLNRWRGRWLDFLSNLEYISPQSGHAYGILPDNLYTISVCELTKKKRYIHITMLGSEVYPNFVLGDGRITIDELSRPDAYTYPQITNSFIIDEHWNVSFASPTIVDKLKKLKVFDE